MIPAANGSQLVFQGFGLFPRGGQRGGGGGVPRAKKEREMVGVPVGPAGGVRDEEPGLRSSGQLGQVAVGEESVFPDLQPLPRRRQAGMHGERPHLLKLLLGSEDGGDRSISFDEVVNDALREGGATGVGRTTVDMHQRVTASVGDQITVPWHFDVTGVFPEEGDRGDTPALKWEGFAVSQV